MFKSTSKKERRLGIPLFLKPHRSAGPKSAMARRPQRPGQHGKSRRRAPSEYSEQLAEKQKFRYTYGLREKQLLNYFKKASSKSETTGPALMSLLERRLDNVVFRLGFAPSRSVARQVVGHGHIMVGKKKMKAPSYLVKEKDVISIRNESSGLLLFKELPESLMNHDAPAWLKVDPQKMTGTVVSMPVDLDAPFDISKVVDYYSKTAK